LKHSPSRPRFPLQGISVTCAARARDHTRYIFLFPPLISPARNGRKEESPDPDFRPGFTTERKLNVFSACEPAYRISSARRGYPAQPYEVAPFSALVTLRAGLHDILRIFRVLGCASSCPHGGGALQLLCFPFSRPPCKADAWSSNAGRWLYPQNQQKNRANKRDPLPGLVIVHVPDTSAHSSSALLRVERGDPW
jgi:hypothetical protein